MKFVLNSEGKNITLDINNIKRIAGLSQSNLIVIMTTGETYTGHVIEVIKD